MRVEAGKLPTCVHHCQAGVMVYGTLEELAAKAAAAAKDKMVIFAKRSSGSACLPARGTARRCGSCRGRQEARRTKRQGLRGRFA